MDESYVESYKSPYPAGINIRSRTKSQIEWDNFYLGLAKYISTKSKDPSTKFGCVLVRPDHSLASVGFNGFPQRMPDVKYLYENREEKYSRIIHGEMNAITFCADTNLDGYTSYGYPFIPCDRCFGVMIQNGISRYVAPKATSERLSRWGESFDKVRQYAKECDVELIEVDLREDVWAEPIPNSEDPCNRKCGVSSITGLCSGCFRTLKEIAEWSKLTKEEKQEVVKQLSERKNKK